MSQIDPSELRDRLQSGEPVTVVDIRESDEYAGWHIHGSRNLPDAPLGTYYRTGFAHNMLFVIPEWDMVIVRLGTDENPKDITGTPRIVVWNEVLRRVGLAVGSPPTPQQVVSFTLINADTDQVVAGHDPLVDGARVFLGGDRACKGPRHCHDYRGDPKPAMEKEF